ncbi:MAG TPA: NADH-quinone oxidoreductase subunit J [Candidatus Acidoferrales bacterium]|jgi:NADH-quinone oxidoreductase subunit J|nr:NADH-quinone oxidoreductase subunit J [Candidatus Acidoferrales bacterium]
MNLPLIVFFFFALLAVAGAVMLILAREPIHSALSLILVMTALATLYLLLGAEFIAAVQIIVYAGAVMVLFVFVIMLLNMGNEERTNFSKFAYVGLVAAFVLLLEAAHWMYRSPLGRVVANGPEPATSFSTVELSKLLFRSYLLPFEATSILILIAILGALVLARKEE